MYKVIVATAAALLGCLSVAQAQEDLTRYPTDVLGSAEMAKLRRPNPETCDLILSSKLESNVARIYTHSSRCEAFDRDLYDQYTDNRSGFTVTLEQKNDPINFFRYHDIDITPYRAAIAQLGFGQHDVGPRGAGPRASAPLGDGTAFGTRSTPRAAAIPDTQARMAELQAAPAYRPAASEFADGGAPGACGIPYLDQDAKSYQAFIASEGECAEYVAEVEAEGY